MLEIAEKNGVNVVVVVAALLYLSLLEFVL